jgi:DNA-binding transcriptional LysR family regulator
MPIQSIASGEVDLALGVDVASAPAVDREEIFRTPWVLWCAPSHPVAKKEVLRWNDLHDLDFVEAGTNPEASILEMRNFAPQHHPSAGFQWVSHFSTALGIAAQGLAVTTGPAYADVMARLYGLKMLRITEPEVVRQVCLYRPAKTVMSSTAEAFRSFAIAYIRKWTLDARTISPLDD